MFASSVATKTVVESLMAQHLSTHYRLAIEMCLHIRHTLQGAQWLIIKHPCISNHNSGEIKDITQLSQPYAQTAYLYLQCCLYIYVESACFRSSQQLAHQLINNYQLNVVIGSSNKVLACNSNCTLLICSRL